MDQPVMFSTRTVSDDTTAIESYFPVPGFGILPVNAFVIRAAEPVLIDTGLAALREEFMDALRRAVDVESLRWIWLTHIDPDHVGNLEAVLAAAPRAQVVTTYLGMGKLNLRQLPTDRVHLLNPGQRLEAGDRSLLSVMPPTFDAPETCGAFDTRSRTLFSADCFGALLEAPAESAGAISQGALAQGAIAWATVDAPWLSLVDAGRFRISLEDIRRLEAEVVLSSHLPPARGMTDTLLGHLDAAREAPPFRGPDQAEMERMMAGAAA